MSANGLQTLWPELFIETSILVVFSLAIAFYTIRYPFTIEAQGKVTSNDSVELLVPYKYLYLFDEPRTARISVEGQDKDAMPCVCRINYYSRNLIVVEGKHYFRATASIRSFSFSAQPGLDVFARIVVSDKTLWQQVFR